ncbi:MAG: WD40 repeat domain-containing protein [Verrucomicrobia bacterium]|nr:WD40 repeat domain-containing protein [Verrucomicrobiota bacterium]
MFRLWNLETGQLLGEPTFKQEQYTPAAVSPDGKTVALFSASGPIYRLRLGGGAAAPLVLPRYPGIRMASFMPKPPARLLWFTTAGAKAIDVVSGREVAGGFAFPVPVPNFSGGAMRSQFGGTTGAGLTLFVQPQPGTWRAWTLGENGVAHDVLLTDIPGELASFRNATRNLVPATGVGSGSTAVGIWNVRSGQRVTAIKTEFPVSNPDTLTVLSPDETRVAFQTATDLVVHVCDIASGKELFVVQLSGKESINRFRFSPNSAQLLTGGNWGGVQVWDAATGKLLRSTQAHRTNVTRFDFSADGQYYASVSSDGSVQVWDAASHAPVGPPLVQTGAAARADFSPDGTRIVTPSNGGTARIWDVRSGLPLTGAMNHDGVVVIVVAYSPDGRFVTTQANPSTAKNPAQRLWAAPPDGRGARTPEWLLRLATICAGQRLTDEGKFVIAVDEMTKLDEIRRELAALPDGAPYVEWGRWFLSDSPTRSIAPGFTITPAEARKLAEEMRRE